MFKVKLRLPITFKPVDLAKQLYETFSLNALKFKIIKIRFVVLFKQDLKNQDTSPLHININSSNFTRIFFRRLK